MKCLSCKKDNIDGVKFCKYCGSPMRGGFKTCSNGHVYDSTKANCPFCPQFDEEKTFVGSSTSAKTENAFSSNFDKTIIDTSSPTLPSGPSNSDRTVIYNSAPTTTAQRKLVAWLVTYDIDPNGIDYKLYEGRTKLGRSNRNDVIINQPGVSDEHSILLYRDNKFIIQDNLSTNGTYVNDVSIDEKVILKNDDVVKLGNISLKLKII